MSDPIAAAVAWLASSGAPNWIVLLALLTRPSVWSRAVAERVEPAIAKILPGGER